jgi:glycosyltransferase involved in cell wall biosynthesis
MNRFRIIITNYNAVKYINKCLDSAVAQDYPNFDVVVVDDCSTDGTWDIIQQYKVYSIRHKKNICCGVVSIKEGMNYLPMNKDDIVVLLSGDDYLNDDRVLATLNEAYTDDIWMTYGQFVPISGGYPAYCKPIPDTRTYRKEPVWYASHLITFRRWLWDKIDDNDFKYKNDYTHYATDAAMLFPMIEMCGKKHMKFIEKILYVYNDMNPECVYKILPEENLREAMSFRKKPIYKEL